MTSIFCTSLSLTQLPSDLITNHSGITWYIRGASSRLARCPVSLMLGLSRADQAAEKNPYLSQGATVFSDMPRGEEPDQGAEAEQGWRYRQGFVSGHLVAQWQGQ